ncbi:MAG: thioester reductase domain-containing protein [Lachnospiraceae bacterium]|nr:thioester reductase domain-containing protein [Lachnospiraceae bacterium]
MRTKPTLIDYLKDKAADASDRAVFRFVDYDDNTQTWLQEKHTFSEAWHRALEVAYMLRKKGLRPGDRAVIFSMQDFGTMYAVYGCMMAGVVFTIIPPPLDEDKTEHLISVLRSCHPKALISNYELEQDSDVNIAGRLLREAFRDTVRLKRIYTDRLDPYRREDVIVPASPDQLVYLQYTSGSTKAPKGVRVTWKNLMKNIEQCSASLSLDNVSLATWVPFFHNLGLVVTICMPIVATSSTGYFLQTLRFLENPKLWIRLISDFKITLTVGPGSAYDACTRIFSDAEAAKYSLGQVTHFMNGSEFISAKSAGRFTSMFRCPPDAMAPGYGVSENVCLATFASRDYRTLTLDYEAYQKNRAVIVEDTGGADTAGGETASVQRGERNTANTPRTANITGSEAASAQNEVQNAANTPHTANITGSVAGSAQPEAQTSRHTTEIVSVGRPVKDLTVVIGNPKTKKVYPDLHIGEIFLSGDSVADGYWDNPKDSRNFHVKMEGYDCEFYKTGDLGFLYEGNLYITGRIKEMIIVNGHNIYPSDLQATISRHVPALTGASYGFFSCTADTKENVVAVIEARQGENFAKRVQEVNRVVSDRFAFSFYDIVFVPQNTLPRTDNRKLQMLKTRALYQEGSLQVLYSSHDASVRKKSSSLIEKSSEFADEVIDKSIERADVLTDKADDILLQVHSTFQRVLKIDQFSLTDSFLALGGDSLMGFELIHNIEEKYHIKLDLRELLRDASVTGITRYIHSVLSGTTGRGKAVNLASECRLDERIRFKEDYLTVPADCRKIFLTGATGFLGAQLIHSIFRFYPHSGLELWCLVRADSEEAAMERIRNNMKHYRCWNDGMEHYIRPVTGDLASYRLGLDDETWTALSERIEVIYHNGAVLNFVFPYEYLKATNVNGTVETLRLAGAGCAKYYHYVSSYSVYDTPDNSGRHVMEDAALSNRHGFSLSYSETKWVSEKIIGIAQKRGLRAAIYRPGDITGAANGIWELEDMVSRLMVSTIQMKAVPYARYEFHMTPVDYVAKALIYISRKEEALGHAFNLVNPAPQTLNTVVAYIRACGYTVRRIPFRAWRNRIRKSDASENAMVLLECLFEAGNDSNPNVLRHFVSKNATYDTGNARLLLGRSGITCPPVDQKYIAAYLKHFKSKHYI